MPGIRGCVFGRMTEARGSALVEYLILVGVVALLAIHAFAAFGGDVGGVVNQEGANVAKLGF
jgi:Flp pilus assembly pilin Flp